MEKRRERRYQSARELGNELNQLRQRLASGATATVSVSQIMRKPWIALPTILAIVVLVLAGSWFVKPNAKIHWAREQALPQILQLMEKDKNFEAFALAREVEGYIPNDPILVKLWPQMSRLVAIHSSPEGADVYVKPYEARSEEHTSELQSR